MKKRFFSLRRQMVLVYLLGGALPMLLIIGILIGNQRRTMLEQAGTAAVTELTMLKNTLGNQCNVLTDVSKRMYFDKELEKISETQYADYASVVDTYRTYTQLGDLENYYSADIEGITVYLDNQTLTGNSQLSRVNRDTREAEWYRTALQDNGRARWWYIRSPADGNCYLTLVRLIRSSNGEKVGVENLRMNPQNLRTQFAERSSDTYLLLDDGTVVLGRDGSTAPDELPALVQQYAGQAGSFRVDVGGETNLLTVETLDDTAYCNNLVLLSLEPYDVILDSVAYTMRRTLVVAVVGAVLAILAIFALSLYFSQRVDRFRGEMEKAARGERALATTIGGGDEIADLYTYLNSMIHDIDTLTASVYESKLERERARSCQREAEFKMLASQINPHFLFNTLESIRMKARACGDTEVADMVKMLAKLMRHSIEVRNTLVTVKDELALTEYYLKLQHYRFGDAVQFDVTADPGCEQLFILPLLVQPLVENAFVHGLKTRRAGGHITVHAAADKTTLTITVTDNGVGMTPAALDALRQSLEVEDFDHSHIGVANVHHRVRMFYGAGWGLTVDSAPGQGTTAALHLPRCETNEKRNKEDAVLLTKRSLPCWRLHCC